MSSRDVVAREEIERTIIAHVAAVGAADGGALALLYAADAELEDPAGKTVAVGRSAIGRYFSEVLTEPRATEVVFVAVAEHQAAVHFQATPAGGNTRDVIDTMTFNAQGEITSMQAYAG